MANKDFSRRAVLQASVAACFALVAVATFAQAPRAADAGLTDWPSYNRTLTSERYVPLDQINKTNVANLRQICVYDLNVDTRFETGPIVIGQTLYGTTDTDTFAIDAATCQQKWRVSETCVAGLPSIEG
jgi:alcohol dehydrogenase (cytochrome c)